MSKVQSGLLFIGIAVLVNLGGRLLPALPPGSQNIGYAGFVVVLMLGSLVFGLFGLFRLISGLLQKKPKDG